MVFPARFERAASGLGILRSIRLSYGNIMTKLTGFFEKVHDDVIKKCL